MVLAQHNITMLMMLELHLEAHLQPRLWTTASPHQLLCIYKPSLPSEALVPTLQQQSQQIFPSQENQTGLWHEPSTLPHAFSLQAQLVGRSFYFRHTAIFFGAQAYFFKSPCPMSRYF